MPLGPGLDRLQWLEVRVRVVAHAFLPSCSAVGIGAALRESLLGQMAAASYRAQSASATRHDWQVCRGAFGSGRVQIWSRLRIGQNVRGTWGLERIECLGWQSGSLQSRQCVQ